MATKEPQPSYLKKKVTPQTYIRNLPAKMMYEMAAELDHKTAGSSWKDLAVNIPKSRDDPEPKFSMTNIRCVDLFTRLESLPCACNKNRNAYRTAGSQSRGKCVQLSSK